MASRKCLTLEVKVAIIKAVADNVKGNKKKGEIAKEFGIPQSSLSTILKDKTKILNAYEHGKTSARRKKMRHAQYEDVEEALFDWFKDIRAKNIPVSGEMLREKAKTFAFLMGHENFKVSEGWVGKFKQRHDILCKKLCGEAASISDICVGEWLDANLPKIMKYEDSDIFNMDETGVFFRAMPEQTLMIKGDVCHGGKKSKDRVSVALCCNMDGSEKLKLLVIGRSKNPRCFKGIRSLPVEYKSNKKAWMTRHIFEEWLLSLDKKFKKAGRQILLLLDNASSHVTSVRLDAIELLFFPPNATSKIQPLDQGIIRSVKANYRRRLVKLILLNIEGNRPTKIDVRMAVEMLYGAWQEVEETTIRKCFRSAGIVRDNDDHVEADENNDTGDREDDDRELWARINVQDCDFDTFVALDEDLIANEEITDRDIAQSVMDKNSSNSIANDDSSDDDCVDIDYEHQPVPVATALDGLHSLRRFFEEKDGIKPEIHDYLLKMENEIFNVALHKTVQKKITDFIPSRPDVNSM